MESLAIYIHVPFCERKCGYCDFNVYTGLRGLSQDYVDAIRSEIGSAPERARPVKTVFFGGGTPTYLSGEQLTGILDCIRESFAVDSDAEISAEANPTTSDADRFTVMRQAGFNRLSIGVQSFDDRLLPLIDREHTADEAEDAVHRAREAGFENVSIDLMFGLPTQTLTEWDATLDRAIRLETEHVSAYALTIEPGTRFERLRAGGKLDLPDDDIQVAMYERAIERLSAAGFEHYEVSNFARPGYRSRHNVVYWLNEDYLGFGPGAVSYVDGKRWTKEKHPARYVAKVRDEMDLTIESEQLDSIAALSETLIQGLRLRDGVSLNRLGARFGIDVGERFREPFERLDRLGHLERAGDTVRLTHRGLLLADDVALELLPD